MDYCRFNRQIKLPEVGECGQKRLLQSKVLVVGVGGLGGVLSSFLGASGVGKLTLVDDDNVELSNLQRQVIFSEKDVGQKKVLAAKRTISAQNSEIEIDAVSNRFEIKNSLELVLKNDIVVDCTDNLRTRYILNDACFFAKKPLAYGSVHRFRGQSSLFLDSCNAPCYRCLFPTMPKIKIASCNEAGVLGPVPGLVAMIQANEVLKYLLGAGEGLSGFLLKFNALDMTFDKTRLVKDPGCPVCSSKAKIKSIEDTKEELSRLMDKDYNLSPQELKEILDSEKSVKLVDIREPDEWAEGVIPGAEKISMGKLAEHLESETVSKDTELILYCRGGTRSERTLLELREKGFSRVMHLDGGIVSWRNLCS